jgi:type II secretion system protein F
MPYFTYKAKDKKGQLINGTLEAETRASAASRLQVMGYFPIDVGGDRKGEKVGLIDSLKQARKSGGRIRSRDLTGFYRQMSDLVGAGVPLVKSLGVVKSQCPNAALRALLSKVDQDVQGGDTFARALQRHPKVFDRLTTALIHAGEIGGLLEETLKRLADFAEGEEEVKGKIKAALAYPVIMTIAGSLAVAVLIGYVIPKIVTIFDDLNQQLPLVTELLIQWSGFLHDYWWMLILGTVALILFLKRYMATEEGRMRIDKLIVRVPLVGDVILKRQIARFSRTLGSLLRNGVPILNALGISKEVLTNRAVRTEVDRVPEAITQGEGMAATLRDSPYFPPVVTNMIAIGEETGNLPGVLIKVAETYETQVDRSVKTLTSIIEPLIILAMGLVVGFIVISMLLPIFQLDPTGGS